MKDCILIVEDEIDLLHGLQRTIPMEIDCEVRIAASAGEALAILAQAPVDLLLADIQMPEMSGMELLTATRRIDASITIVMMTAYGTIEQAVEAIKKGAYDFIRKPIEEEKLIRVLKKGLERNRLVRENERLLKQLCEISPFQDMVGQSEEMQKVFKAIQTVAPTDVTLLIRGESGTGKEMAACAVHALSNRRGRSLVTVNCPALPETILESELFGYRKGAFTHATTDKKGLFSEADGSTIFLDEIGDLSPALQTKLLRVLQEKEIKPLGETKTRKIDIRIIASTNQDLEAKMQDGSFRQDLYYRLNVAGLTMPPLRKRREDLLLLTDHFIRKTACELEIPPKKLTPAARELLLRHSWPGNVRELENTIRGIMAMTAGPQIETGSFQNWAPVESRTAFPPDSDLPYKVVKDQILEQFTTAYVTRLLEKTSGNVSLAAERSGIKRQSLQKILKRYRIDPEQFRPDHAR
ncbi:MAG: sigma-54-dependent Fis family transcriptional regulator [Desulfosarcina sp.]|nr:sigma-54-dependent Fis family transcriptional regulator [Desulfobacterales bacterium]